MSSALDRYGVVGHPVSHSLSPFIHGMFARETAQAMSYQPYDVMPADFAAHVREFFRHGGRGLNVTLPHKIAAVHVADELTGRAAQAAAVNTLALEDGHILGDNTDGAGLVRDLCSAAQPAARGAGDRQPHSRARRGPGSGVRRSWQP
jgi:shikimate dehydrogenase